jgi:hypothetical protein
MINPRNPLVMFIREWYEVILGILLIVLLVTSLVTCTGVAVYRHPDLSYAPTNPALVGVYLPNFTPNYNFIIIGEITIDATWTISPSAGEKKIAKKAASLGADGIIITTIDVDWVAFNHFYQVNGYSQHGIFNASITEGYLGYRTVIIHGYLIKRMP